MSGRFLNYSALLILPFFLASCSSHKIEDNHYKCSEYKPVLTPILLDFENLKFSETVQVWKTPPCDVSLLTMNHNELTSLLASINGFPNSNKKSVGTVLYFEGELKDSTRIVPHDLLGISIYFLEDEDLFHTLHVNKANQFVEDIRLRCKVNNLTMNDYYKILLDYFVDSKSKSKSWILIVDSNYKIKHKREKESNLSKRIRRVLQNHE